MGLLIDNKILEEVQQSLAAYLPGGPLWEAAMVPGTNINAVMAGLSGLLLDTEVFNQVYNSEFIPSSDGTNFLENWEQAVSIPDSCFPGPDEPDRSVRRLHVLVKLSSLGVQTSADFEALAVTLGFPTVTVTSGIDEGIPEPEGQYTIVVKLPDEGIGFVYTFPLPFLSTDQTIIECIFRKLKPDNCAVQFGTI